MLIRFWQSLQTLSYRISPDYHFHQIYWYNWYLSALFKLYEMQTYQISVQLGYLNMLPLPSGKRAEQV
jgi:hypothetical protein